MWRHRGDRYECPLCGFRAAEFDFTGFHARVLEEKQVIGSGRRKALCFGCGSTDRERLVYLYLRDVAIPEMGDAERRVLHIAPERRLMQKLGEQTFREYVCGDKRTAGYAFPDSVHHVDLLDLPFASNHFDLLICDHVLEHVHDDATAMRELHRVLTPGGRAILQVPISAVLRETFEDPTVPPEERERVFGQADHVRIYGQDYVDRLTAAGFRVERVNISRQYSRSGLNPSEDLFIGHK